MDIFYDIKDMAVRTVNSTNDVVVEVHYKITGIGELGSAITISKEISFESVDSENFIEFENLSKEQVISWLFNDNYTEEHLREELLEGLDKNKKIFKKPLAWT